MSWVGCSKARLTRAAATGSKAFLLLLSEAQLYSMYASKHKLGVASDISHKLAWQNCTRLCPLSVAGTEQWLEQQQQQLRLPCFCCQGLSCTAVLIVPKSPVKLAGTWALLFAGCSKALIGKGSSTCKTSLCLLSGAQMCSIYAENTKLVLRLIQAQVGLTSVLQSCALCRL